LERDVIQTPGYPSSALAPVEPRSNYFASQTHYQSLARRIAATLSRGGRFVLATGDPPADPQLLRQALGDVEGVGYAVIDIRCGPALRGKDLALAASMLTGPSRSGGAVAAPEASETISPLFLFIDFDQLSDRQIEEICEDTLGGDQLRASGVLLAPLDFAARLERPPLRFLRERLAGHLCIQEVADDEVIPFLHNQLLAQRDRRSEVRGFRRGILIGLGAFGVVAAAGSSAFLLLHPIAEQVCEAPASMEETRLTGEQVSMLRSTESAPNAVPVQAFPETQRIATSTVTSTALSATTAPPTTGVGSLSPAPSAPAHRRGGPGLSATEVGALVERGNAFFSSRDVSSARLYYERAAEAGDGQAALQLGASFDPDLLERAGVRGVVGDPAQALFWYRTARALAKPETEPRIKSLETRLSGDADTRSR
jgi:hypothetical protein